MKIKAGDIVDFTDEAAQEVMRFCPKHKGLSVQSTTSSNVNVYGKDGLTWLFPLNKVEKVYKRIKIKDIPMEELKGRRFRRSSYIKLNSYVYFDVAKQMWIYKETKDADEQKLSTDSFNSSDWYEIESMTVEEVAKLPETMEDVIERGKQVQVMEIKEINLEDVEDVTVVGDTVEERFLNIAGSMSQITKGINEKAIMDSHKDLVENFMEVKNKLQDLSTPTASKWGWMPKVLTSNRFVSKVVDSVEDVHDRNSSTQKQIDYMFGLIYEKYEQFLDMGENLQKSKVKMSKEIEALKTLEIESDEELSGYDDPTAVPIRAISLNTRIKTSIEKYTNRLTKVDGAIKATQATIQALSRDLPSMKSDLTDEMAISSLLNSVGDYQKMYQEIAGLVSNVAEATSKHTYEVVENLFDMQINDKATIEYLQKSEKATDEFKKMLVDKSEKLTKKTLEDAKIVASLTNTALPYRPKAEPIYVPKEVVAVQEN